MIKLVIFDLDGVLVDAKHIHYECLNKALAEVSTDYIISEVEHHASYDGLKTHEKLEKLTINKKLPTKFYQQIWKRKQVLTLKSISALHQNDKLIELFTKLKNDGYEIAVCSNSIRRSVLTMLSKIGIIEFLDLILSNEDVNNSKPHPEMYWKGMSIMKKLPEETLIVEDSPVGLLAASRSSACVLRVSSPLDVTEEKIYDTLKNRSSIIIPKWQGGKLNILIPMSGAGSRFQQAGYTFPKPLIEVEGKPMIQVVVDNLNIDANYIFVVLKEHRAKYNLDSMLNLIAPSSKIVEVDKLTDGAACTTLLAKEFIDNDVPLIIANSDQFIEWDSNKFMYKMQEQKLDAGIVVFESSHPKWSFAKVDERGYVIEVAEKNPISTTATAGVYYWSKGSDYVKYAEQMIRKNIRVNGEYYVCPVYNEAIQDNKKIKTFGINQMWGLGTPEDLKYYLDRKK